MSLKRSESWTTCNSTCYKKTSSYPFYQIYNGTCDSHLGKCNCHTLRHLNKMGVFPFLLFSFMYSPSSSLFAFLSCIILNLKKNLQIVIAIAVGWIFLNSPLGWEDGLTHLLCLVLRSILTTVTAIVLTLNALHFPDLVKTLNGCLL